MNKLIEQTVEILHSGGIIAFPTDTVFGLGCNAFNEKAVRKIYELKKRAPDKPLILFICKKVNAKKYAHIPPAGKTLIEKFWPGPLTIIFRSKNKVPLIEYKSKISIRIPFADAILEILQQYGGPLATTSANLEGAEPALNHKQLKIKPDIIIPGNCNHNQPSTIIDVSVSPPYIIRNGKFNIPQI